MLISLHEAGKLLGVSEKSIRRYVAAGRITGYRVGPRMVRVERDDVENLLRPIPAISPTNDGGRAA